MTWKQLAERDDREWKLSASQLPGRGPTVVDMAPGCTCTLIKNLMMMM